MFQFLNFEGQRLQLDGLAVSSLPSSSERVALDIELSLMPVNQHLVGVFRYSTDLFDASTIARMVDHFRHLLEAIVSDPECPVDELVMVGVAERQQLLVTWNDTSEPPHSVQSVHGLFEAQVVRTPNAIAVRFEGDELSYSGLNIRANKLAHHLLALGVNSQTLVGLFVERSLELVVGILGVMKAGAAYVPLDPDHPAERLDGMLTDAGVRYLVTQKRLVSFMPGAIEQQICLDVDDAWQTNQDPANPCRESAVDDRAYVMYTSGSTGRPKGVQVPHRAVVNLLSSMARQPGITSADRLLSVTTPTFDISVLELMLPLTIGASVEIAGKDVVADPAALSACLARSRPTFMQATPTTWQMLVNHGWMGSRTLKVLCGGEALPDQLAADLLERSGELWNMYGPTETTVWSTIKQVCDPDQFGSIGTPIANTQVYVVDSRLQPVPVGIPGELCIGGAGVSLGYLNRAELTAEKFVMIPFTADPSARMYRTGDLVRRLADGSLEFLGRLDHQVKLRGFRIELGEIEAALHLHPAIKQSVVVLREDRPGERRLVAYLVKDMAQPLEISDIRALLRSRLPEYMRPSTYVALDALPLSLAGKINRLALPAPDDTRFESATSYVAPRSSNEVLLEEIWREVLGLQKVGIHDNFFVLGGHSLLATRVVARIRSHLGRGVSLRTLFEAPTIAELAQRLDTHGAPLIPETTAGHFISIVRPLSDRGNVICVGGHVIELLQQLPADIGIIFLGSGSLAPERFHALGIDGAVKRYLKELVALDVKGRQVVVGYSYSGLVAYELCARLRQLIETPVDAVLLEPSLRIPRQHPALSLLLRTARYVAKLFRHGPGVIVNSVRRRHEEHLLAREALPVVDDMAEWNAIWPGLRRNIAKYRPTDTDSRGIHVVAGGAWLARQLDRFRLQLADSPQIHEQGEVTHDGLVEDQPTITRWRQLITRILDDR